MKPKVETWRKFWRLSSFEQGTVLIAAAALSATCVGLHLCGFRRWKNLLVRLAPTANAAQASGDQTEAALALEIARWTAAAARILFFCTSCLEQSLVLWWLLARRGIAAELRFGAHREKDCFEAHAWVELRGEVLNDVAEALVRFVPFDDPIASPNSFR